MATKQKARAKKIKDLRTKSLEANRAKGVQGGYIGETEKVRSRPLPCDGSSKDPAY